MKYENIVDRQLFFTCTFTSTCTLISRSDLLLKSFIYASDMDDIRVKVTVTAKVKNEGGGRCKEFLCIGNTLTEV